MSSLLLHDVELDGRRADVRVAEGRISEVGRSLGRRSGEEIVDGRGGALLPGLVDHHLHLMAMAARSASVDLTPPAVVALGSLRAVLAQASPNSQGWIRAVGYDEQVAGRLDRYLLDEVCGTPLRVQERSGALWVLNSAGCRELALDACREEWAERDEQGRFTGRLWRADAWLRDRLGPTDPPDLAAVGSRLAACGITAVTDATPDLAAPTLALLAEARAGGAIPQQVMVLGADEAPPGLTVGPRKVMLSDHALPPLPELVELLRPLRAARRPVAVHCVTREALVLLLTALDEAGRVPGDRIEHAAVVPEELLARLSGLPVITQPGFIADRGSRYRRTVAEDDLCGLYRYASLLGAGVPVAPSSDAPHGPVDPWLAIRTASSRLADDGQVLGADERVAPGRALAGYLSGTQDPGGPARRLHSGVPADLCLLRVPLEEALRDPCAEQVRLTLVGGKVVHAAD